MPVSATEFQGIGIKTVLIGSYVYNVTPGDLQMEQQAFEAGEGVSLKCVPVDYMTCQTE